MCRKLFYFQSMSAPRKRRSSPTVANDGCADIGFRGKWTQKNMGLLLDLKGEKAHQICSFMWADNF